MSLVFIHAKIYTGETVIEDGFIRFNQEIQTIGSMTDFAPVSYQEEITNLNGQIIIPGFIDVHSHGGYGTDVMDGDPEAINKMTKEMLREGITSYFPTTMTQSDENIERALRGIRQARKTNPVIRGVHLEGPFVSTAHKGAQLEEFMRIAEAETMKKWHEMAGGICLVTYAPEIGDVSSFEAYCEENDIILSVGHSGATYEQLKNSKATHVTHLFNGQLGLHHREIGVAGFGLLEDEIYTEMIVDGYHITPEMVKLAYKTKGPKNILLITDSIRAKGITAGESELGGQRVIVKDKQARLKNGTLAGSVLTFIDAFRNMIEFSGCSIEDAVQMSSVNQAREFELDKKGKLKTAFDADFVVLDQNLKVKQTILGGTVHEFE